MGRSKKWEEIYKQTNEQNQMNDDKSRYLVFLSIGDIKNLPTTIPRTSSSSSDNSVVECWVRATLVDADGLAFLDDIAIESKAIPLTDMPSFGLIPIMIGDTHRINVSIDSLEETVNEKKHIHMNPFIFLFLLNSNHHD